MNTLAVLTYQYVTDKPLGMPDSWPAQVVELNEGDYLPSNDWVEMTKEEYESYKAAHQASYNSWETSFNADSKLDAQIQASIGRASDFGYAMIDSFKVANVKKGITQSGKTVAVTLYCHKLDHYLSTGSLYAAIGELDFMLGDSANRSSLGLFPFITDSVLTGYKNQVQDFLGIPRT